LRRSARRVAPGGQVREKGKGDDAKLVPAGPGRKHYFELKRAGCFPGAMRVEIRKERENFMPNPLVRRTLAYCSVSAAAGGVVSAAYMVVTGGLSWREVGAGFCIGGLISITLTWFELDFHRTYLKRLSLGAAFLISVAFYSVVLIGGITVLTFLFGLAAEPFSAGALRRFWTQPDFTRGMGFALCLSAVFIYVTYSVRLVGGRALISLFTGRYHTPLEERLIFLFLDLRDSTKIAESIGPVNFMQLLNEFFTDVAHAVVASRGEIHKYVGDEAIVVWPLGKAGADPGCVQCVFALREKIARQAKSYERKYGLAPGFRAALHGGEVVTGEIGYFRQEIAHMGDVLNTTARILDQCRALGEEVLASEAALENVTLPGGLRARPVGEFLLRGKEKPLALFAIE
jgi:adenylate cyclase